MTPNIDPSFVGRVRELDQFQSSLRAAFEGRRQILLLSGEPGIGKTRCAEMFARVAEDNGALVLWGRCYEEPGAPPYWPWVQILREYVQSSSESELRLMTAALAQEIAAIVPDLFDRTEVRPTTVSVTSDHERFRIFDAITQYFASAARHVPLVLILDNLHCADTPSLSLLEFLSQELASSRILLIGTYRDVQVSHRGPLPNTLGSLCRESGVERMRLTGLPANSIADLAERVLHIKLPQQAIDAIYQQTDGNPLFVIELLKVLQNESVNIGVESIAVRIPDGVRETIGRRLSHLTEYCNELLAIGSVLGRHFTALEIATVAEKDFKIVLTELEGAVRAGLIEPRLEVDGYRFMHALIREVLYDELPALARIKLHGRIADTLAEMHRADLTPLLSTIAHHYYQAASVGYAEQAITFAFRAAESATQMCAYEDAVAHYDRALGALSLIGNVDDARVVRALFLKGCALTLLGDTKYATEALLQGVKQAVRLQSPLLVDVITSLMWATSFGPQSHLAPLLERTLNTLPCIDSVARARALAALAFALRGAGNEARIDSLVTEAVAMAERLADSAVLCACIKFSIMAMRDDPRTLFARMALGAQYVAVACRAGNNEVLSDAYSWQVLHLLDAARVTELESLLTEYGQVSVARFGLHQYFVRSAEATLALLRGDWQNAEQKIEALLVIGTRTKTRRADAEGVYSAQMFALHRDLGKLRALRPMVEQSIHNSAANTWMPGLMLLCTELGMQNEARDCFEQLAEQEFRTIPRDDMFVTCLVFCSEVCYRLRDAKRAAALYALLLPYAGSVANHPRALSFGAADLYLAMLAATRSDAKCAQAHFEIALSTNRTMKAWPWLARTLFHFGTMLLTLASTSEQTRGRSLIHDAEQLAVRLGMAGLVEQIGSGSRGDTHYAFPDGLTAREIEVLQLIAIGRSNKDISMVLAISLNTVATHVRSILEKTNSANRTEAAAYAMQNKLQVSAVGNSIQ